MAVLAAIVVTACVSETTPPDPVGRAALADGVSPAESLAILRQLGESRMAAASALSASVTCTLAWDAPGAVSGCSAPVPAVVPAVPWLEHVGQARDSGEIEQREPISIAFVGTVRAVTLSSTGGLWCSGFHGRMVGFRDGTEVVRADNVLIDPSDCGLDDVTYGVRGELPPEVDIDSLVIEGVDPWVAPVLGECCGRALLKYTVQYRPPFDISSVTCTPTPVVRANTVTCSATWDPPISPADILFEWEFQGDSIRVFPDPTARPYDPPPPVDSAGQGMSGWSGPAVLGGQVSLRATWQGHVATASTQIVVSPRSASPWGALPMSLDPAIRDIETDYSKTLDSQPPPPGAPDVLGIFGMNVDSATNSTAYSVLVNGSPTVATVPLGPNRGLAYIIAPGIRSSRGLLIRTWLTGREDAKFSYHRVPNTLLTNRGLLNAMRRNANSPKSKFEADSTDFLEGVIAHETYGREGGKGHQGEFELAAMSLVTCGRVPTIMERVVGVDSLQAASRAIDHVLLQGIKAVAAAGDHDRVHGNWTDAPHYEVVSQVTVADHTTPYKITTDLLWFADYPFTNPDPQWKCSREF